jgi:hypothetical protein
METLLGILLGIGLSAACGFRVFVPMLGISIASLSGHLTLAPGFEWIGSPVALVAFGLATVLEIAAYYIPWLDNLMDSIATPAAVIAGTVAMASVVTGMSPFLTWTLAIIAGGGTAAIIQGGTVVTRAASTATTGGTGNPVVSTVELAGAVLGTVLAVIVPVVTAVAVVLLCAWIVRKLIRWCRRKHRSDPVVERGQLS